MADPAAAATAAGSDPIVADRRAVLGPAPGAVHEVEVDGRLSLYRRDADHVVVLNETASDVWRLADGTLGDDEIVELLARAYGVDGSVIEADVRATLARLVQEGFLTLDLR